uniref:Vacuolar protein sorting-associated protein 35 n=1 Tax=Syphacia muris TaxID=451379 RepID=A0A0N5AF59_9BILA
MTKLEDAYLSSTEQEKILSEAEQVVKTEAFEMKRCLDKGLLMDALKHATQILSELRTGALTPKYYYRLHVDAMNQLQHLETHLTEEYEKGKKIAELYESVQYASSIIPRLYLLVTVGVVYIKAEGASPREILKDLVEMCRGVQHPLRGLFLRSYLLQCTRNLLPDLPEDAADDKGNVNDAIDFIMLNFSEMNKLWVRMQHQGPSKEKDKRERERRELRVLVGTNLVRLSQLDHLDIDIYKKTVLPGILEQSVSCKDPISQEYLMECVIQVFPDEYHLATLHEFLNACSELHQGVQIKNVLIALIDRLAIYATSEHGKIPDDIPLFDIFSKQVESVISSRNGMPTEDIVALQMALVNFALKCYPNNPDYADTVFKSTSSIFAQLNISRVSHNDAVGRELLKLLKIPVEDYDDAVRLLELAHYSLVLNLLNYKGRTQATSFVLQNMVENDTILSSLEVLEKFLLIAEPLLVDQDDQPEGLEKTEDFAEEQTLVARIVNLIHAETADQQFIMLKTIRKQFGSGGNHRIKYTLPPLVFAVYQLALSFATENRNDTKYCEKLHKMFVFCMHTVDALVTSAKLAELPIRLYLQGALVVGQIDFSERETIAYEYVSKAFSLYEEELSDSRAQFAAISLLTGTLEKLHCFTEENHEPLRMQCAHASAKLFKKPDQCRAVCSVAHLFWSGQSTETKGPMKDGVQVVSCLKKALKVALQCLDQVVQIQLYIHILNHYLYFFEEKCDSITVETLNQVIGKVRDSIMKLESSADNSQIITYFDHTLAHIRNMMDNTNSGVSYEGIVL